MADPKNETSQTLNETPDTAKAEENNENVQAPTQDQLPDPHSPDPIMTRPN